MGKMFINKVELAAEQIHELWMGWAKEMIKSEPNISQKRVERWTKECFIPYSELSEPMKDLDRKFAQGIVDISQTDEYLEPNASFIRLLNEYNQYGSLVIAYDFDNTVYDFHRKGKYYTEVISLLQDLEKMGCTLICFTANEDETFIRSYCKENNIPLHGLNENPAFFKSDAKKIYYNALLDDRAGLIQVYSELKLLTTIARRK